MIKIMIIGVIYHNLLTTFLKIKIKNNKKNNIFIVENCAANFSGG